MVYNITEISLEIKNITTIINEFGKFRYNKVLMGIFDSGDIFQAKLDDLMGDIEGIKTYIEDIMVLNKGIPSQNIDHIRVIFTILGAEGI